MPLEVLTPLFGFGTFALALVVFLQYCHRETLEHEKGQLAQQLLKKNTDFKEVLTINHELIEVLELAAKSEAPTSEFPFFLKKKLGSARLKMEKIDQKEDKAAKSSDDSQSNPAGARTGTHDHTTLVISS